MQMRKQVVQAEAEITQAQMYETALRLYESSGAEAVIEWGHAVRLTFSPCFPCDRFTPELGDPAGTCCAACGGVK